ncbi:hypothetical protein V5R04_06775 [Jonesiaceae bacterium BS-20]|uniref:Uncharacterized protein n=1 Tax=Jonesiaceae bacterium BS-20 TaxID=3120821 RepID=A0AAU7DXN1_9MICO
MTALKSKTNPSLPAAEEGMPEFLSATLTTQFIPDENAHLTLDVDDELPFDLKLHFSGITMHFERSIDVSPVYCRVNRAQDMMTRIWSLTVVEVMKAEILIGGLPRLERWARGAGIEVVETAPRTTDQRQSEDSTLVPAGPVPQAALHAAASSIMKQHGCFRDEDETFRCLEHQDHGFTDGTHCDGAVEEANTALSEALPLIMVHAREQIAQEVATGDGYLPAGKTPRQHIADQIRALPSA